MKYMAEPTFRMLPRVFRVCGSNALVMFYRPLTFALIAASVLEAATWATKAAAC